MTSEPSLSEPDVTASGGSGSSSISASRAGYLPVALGSLPLPALAGLGLHIRSQSGKAPVAEEAAFALYRSGDIAFTQQDRERLLQSGVKFIYIAMSDQSRFREQIEGQLQNTVADPKIAISVKSTLVYETSVELINELLTDPDISRLSPRLETISRAVTTLVVNDPTAFSHLFATSHHDFYTATHMVNVATYMVPLAHELGYHDTHVLNQVCQAGLLHDIGKLYVPEDVLNKTGALSPEDWQALKRHPEMACRHLEEYEGTHEVVLTVAREHHERLDGSGYPAGLVGDQIHPFSRICAVADSFDAMTALRPFRKQALSVGEALRILQSEAPPKYDPGVVAAWTRLLGSIADTDSAADAGLEGTAAPSVNEVSNSYPSYRFNCPARLHILERRPNCWKERPGLQVVAHSISRSGLGVLSRVPVPVGTQVRVYLRTRAWGREFLESLIVRCRTYADGWYEIGMQFTSADMSSQPFQ